jgi:four helix bundle protein
MIRSYTDLEVYQRSFTLAKEIFLLTKQFPEEETYSLTDQIRRSTRSIPANLAEGWSKRRFENIFKKHIVDAIGSCDETKVWLSFAVNCNYISLENFNHLHEQYEQLGKMLYSLLQNWKTFGR